MDSLYALFLINETKGIGIFILPISCSRLKGSLAFSASTTALLTCLFCPFSGALIAD
jgi:hypothetical protein